MVGILDNTSLTPPVPRRDFPRNLIDVVPVHLLRQQVRIEERALMRFYD